MPTARPSTGEQPNSPQKYNEGSLTWIARTWKIDKGGGSAYVPPINESTADGFFKKYRISPEPGGWELLTLEFVSALSGGGGIRADAESQWTLTAATTLEPLNTHADYLTNWNHNLYVPTIDITGYSRPAWWATATDLSDANGTTYLWAIDNPGDAWAKAEDKSKPGVEGWYSPAPVARYEYWNSTKATATSELEDVGTLETPSETFGYSGGSWLVTMAEIREDSGKWRATVEYTYSATGWDTDIYSAGA